jgi:POT family proton-dependent oligopeptide transporter
MTQPAATVATAEAAPAAEPLDNKMPSSIKFIVANEFAERFCFYGINAILTTYLVATLHTSEAQANIYSSLFQGAAYFSPLIGAIVSDVFLGKYGTIIRFSICYAVGCAVVALVHAPWGLALGLGLTALGTGGIKPCVSTNVGDQFTSKNQHLIERAFSYFYLAINAGSTISIIYCPVLLKNYGPVPAFGMPAAMMLFATLVFWMGRRRYAVVPPAGKKWLQDVFSKEGLSTIGSLAIIYFFVAVFWSLWNQSNGQTWTLQARSSLMDKNIGFGITLLPAQIQGFNGPFILILVPIFTFGIYPLWAKLTKVTPLRKIAVGFFVTASSFLLVANIEAHIQAGQTVSCWWQVLAYLILSMGEVLVSITCLEFSYKQAPLRMKSFIMALFLMSSSMGSFITAAVNYGMTKPLHTTGAEIGASTWVHVDGASDFVTGQKIDLQGVDDVKATIASGETAPLQGTYLVKTVDGAGGRVELMDVVERKAVATQGTFDVAKAQVSTYRLVGPQYFQFFTLLMAAVGVIFIFVAMVYKEKTHVREEGAASA